MFTPGNVWLWMAHSAASQSHPVSKFHLQNTRPWLDRDNGYRLYFDMGYLGRGTNFVRGRAHVRTTVVYRDIGESQ